MFEKKFISPGVPVRELLTNSTPTSGVLISSDLTVQGSIGCDYVHSSDIDELKKEIEILKRKTNPEYAQQCAVNELLEKYRKLVLTDDWWEACEAWIYIGVDRIIIQSKKELEEKIRGNTLSFSNGLTYSTITDRSTSSYSYISNDDIFFKTNNKIISINKLLNENPEVEGYEFEKFVIEYCEIEN